MGLVKRRLGAMLLALPTLAACGGTVSASNASCARPYVDDQPPTATYRAPIPTVHPGDSIVLYGHWYTSTCNDTSRAHDPLEPLAPVRLTIALPGGEVARLGPFTPHGKDMGFKATVHVPRHTHAGTARVRDDRVYPARYHFVVSAG